ncbi:MAG TPA: THxN family PEP-CTERM protein [Sphingobium sp.]|nr:THxN family PEP-CTERM protein [Sphingobium sp.]
MNILKALVAISAIAATPAMATVTNISFTNVTATWLSPTGGSNISYSAPGTDNAAIFWGTGGGQKSGYRFETDIPMISVDTDTQMSGITTIGTFTHYNYPINSGSGISGVKLQLTMDVDVDGTLMQDVSFVYAFNHWETPNSSNPCADGGAQGVGINANGCADNVKVNFLMESGFFTIDDIEYALDVQGFLVGDDPATSFWTKENATNVAELRGQVVLRSVAGAVPEPTTWAMMISGFAIAGASLRRRKTAVSFA